MSNRASVFFFVVIMLCPLKNNISIKRYSAFWFCFTSLMAYSEAELRGNDDKRLLV
jgi:hypothetical protein